MEIIENLSKISIEEGYEIREREGKQRISVVSIWYLEQIQRKRSFEWRDKYLALHEYG